MKFSRLAATGAAIALVGGSILVATSAATADTTNYYTSANFTQETSPYAAGWFVGGGSTGSISSSATGLTVDGTSGLEQILNGTTPGTGLAGLVAGAKFNVVSGNAFFQVSLFAAPALPGKGFTTLRPVTANTLTGQWTLSQTVGAFTANTPYDLSTLVAGLPAGYQLLAYGAYVNPGSTAVISSITWGGATSVFTPKPNTPVTPLTPAKPATAVPANASFTG